MPRMFFTRSFGHFRIWQLILDFWGLIFYSIEGCDLQVFVFYGIFLELRRLSRPTWYFWSVYSVSWQNDQIIQLLVFILLQFRKKASYVLNLTFDIGHALAVRKLYSTRVWCWALLIKFALHWSVCGHFRCQFDQQMAPYKYVALVASSSNGWRHMHMMVCHCVKSRLLVHEPDHRYGYHLGGQSIVAISPSYNYVSALFIDMITVAEE